MSALREAAARARESPRIRAAIVLSGGLFACALAYTGIATGGPALCPSRLVTSKPCGSCGMTRAFAALLHGDLAYATEANLASPVAFAIAVLLALAYLAQLATARTYVADFWANRHAKRISTAMLVALFAFGLVTNLQRDRQGRGPLHLAPWHGHQLRPAAH